MRTIPRARLAAANRAANRMQELLADYDSTRSK